MNHWLMEPGNLGDLYEPITKFVEGFVESGKKLQKFFMALKDEQPMF